jgi:hypothetical protein
MNSIFQRSNTAIEKIFADAGRVSASLSTGSARGPPARNGSDGASPCTGNIRKCLIPTTGGLSVRLWWKTPVEPS